MNYCEDDFDRLQAEDDVYCYCCGGSGEGYHENERCIRCGGTGLACSGECDYDEEDIT